MSINQYKLLPIIFSIQFLTALTNAQTNVAVIPLDPKGVSEIEASVLTERLALELFRTGRFTVLERGKMEEILTEQDFQLSGCVSEECLVEVGQLLGVEQMVAGSVSRIGETYSVILRLVSAETGAIVQVASYDHKGAIDELLSKGMRIVALSIAGEPAEPARPPRPVVDGDTRTNARQGHLYIFPRLGYGFNKWFDGLSYGGQIGYGNESWGKVYIDILMIDNNYDSWSRNYLIIYEPNFRRLYWQLGLGFVTGFTLVDNDFGIRACLGYNIALNNYFLFRPALELNLGVDSFRNNYSLNLNFGFKTPKFW